MTSTLLTLEQHTVARATKVALIVGTVLTIANQSGPLAAGPITLPLVLRVGFTYVVPFIVSLYSMLGTAPELRPGSWSRHGGIYICRSCSGAASAVATVERGAPLPDCPRCGPQARWIPQS